MNSSNVSLPSPEITASYIWFMHLTSFLSWSIFPFLFCIILTQSKGLNSYKWFILNHSFWSLMFETIIGLCTPLFLLPAVGGFPLTIIRENGNMHLTGAATIAGLIFGANYIASLIVTIGSRYISTFSPSSTQQLTQRILIIFAMGFLLIAYPLFIYLSILYYCKDINEMHKNAMSFDDFFRNFNEPSMLFFDIKDYKTFLIIALIFLIAVLIAGFMVIIIFVYLVQRNSSSKSVTKIQRSLITSSIVQILLSLLLLIFPISITVTIIFFKIPHNSVYGCISFSLLSTHCSLEFLSTLYFVLPYRKFIKDKWSKFRKLKVFLLM